jgi:hypothetical protein
LEDSKGKVVHGHNVDKRICGVHSQAREGLYGPLRPGVVEHTLSTVLVHVNLGRWSKQLRYCHVKSLLPDLISTKNKEDRPAGISF